jgi:hypothetical protein
MPGLFSRGGKMKRIFRAIYTALGIYSILSSFQRANVGQFLLAGIELLCSIGCFWLSFCEEEK